MKKIRYFLNGPVSNDDDKIAIAELREHGRVFERNAHYADKYIEPHDELDRSDEVRLVKSLLGMG